MFTHGALVVAIAASAPLAAAYLSNSVSYKLKFTSNRLAVSPPARPLLVDSQLHKGLRNSVLVEELPSPIAHLGKDSDGIIPLALDYWKIYSHQLPLLWERAESYCGPRSSWKFDTFIPGGVADSIPQWLDFDSKQISLSFGRRR